jgi:hypothetical protein
MAEGAKPGSSRLANLQRAGIETAVLRHDCDGYIRCRVCGCTECEPCDPPCAWEEGEADLCTICAAAVDTVTSWYLSVNRPSLAALKREVYAAIGRERAGQVAYQSISEKLARLDRDVEHAEGRA